MKKVKALTLIETLLVIVVIALILMVAANQFQRYQQARTIQQAKTAVQMISAYGSQLYLSNCANIVPPTNLVCPAAAATNAGGNSTYCNNSFNIVNPFLLTNLQSNVINYTIAISNDTGVPLITVGLPMSSSSLGKMQGKSPAQIVASPVFQKYIGALQPTFVSFSNASEYYYPILTGGIGNGWFSQPHYSTDDVCSKGSKQEICFVWQISPANWGTMAANTVVNQNLNNQLAAFAGQYVPTVSEWQTIKTANGAIINCPGISAQQIHQNNNP